MKSCQINSTKPSGGINYIPHPTLIYDMAGHHNWAKKSVHGIFEKHPDYCSDNFRVFQLSGAQLIHGSTNHNAAHAERQCSGIT